MSHTSEHIENILSRLAVASLTKGECGLVVESALRLSDLYMTKLAHVVLSKLGWRADEIWTRRTVSSYEATVRHVLETIDYRGGRCGEQGESDGNQNSTAEETEHVGVSIPFFGASQRL